MKAITHRVVLASAVMLLGMLGVAHAGHYYSYDDEHYSPHHASYHWYEGDHYHPSRAGYPSRHRGGVRDASQEWAVLCGHMGAMIKRCVAYSALDGLVGGVWGSAHALSLSANEPGRYRLGWNPRLYVPDGEHPVHLQVDNRYRRSISPGMNGYRGNEFDGYRIETNAALINAMKRGRELTLSYTDIFGDARQVRFSLMGVTKSLQFVDQQLSPSAATKAPVAASVARVYRHK